VRYDLVVRGGRVVTAEGVCAADVAVRGERIAALGRDLRGERELDASGLYVLPGAIDGHIHLTDPTFPPYAISTADSFATASVAAAFGGVTTLIDFAQPAIGQPLLEELERRRSDADGQTVLDYALHLNLRDPDPSRLGEVADVFAAGVTSWKLYMAYEGYRIPDEAIFRAMEAIAARNGLAVLHAENDDVIIERLRLLAEEGKAGPRWLAEACPPEGEAEAVHRAIAMASLAGCRLLVFHLSCEQAVAEVAAAKQRGEPVFGEATSQHLVLDQGLLQPNDFHAQSLAIRPPLRDGRHREALWRGLRQRSIDIVSTDHCPRHPLEDRHPAGASGLEVRLAAVHTFGVRTGKIGLPRWVDVCCTGPARVFGLEQKGRLAPGADADIVLFDPEKRVTLTASTLHSPIDFCSYEGIEVHGFPVVTISRGEVLVEAGEFVGTPGRGRFLARPGS
jgi:dihydropyrimidinase